MNSMIDSRTIACPKHNFIRDSYKGETICKVCGLVVSQKESESMEGIIVPSSSIIPQKDYTGKRVSSNILESLKRSKKIAADQNTQRWHDLVHKYSNYFKLNVNEEKRLNGMIKQIRRIHSTNGKNGNELCFALCYLSAREKGYTVPVKQICPVFNFTVRKINKYVRFLKAMFNFKDTPELKYHISYMGKKLGIKQKYMKLCYDYIIDNNIEKKCVGKRPATIAAAVIYHIMKINGVHITQNQIANIMQVSAISINGIINGVFLVKKKGKSMHPENPR